MVEEKHDPKLKKSHEIIICGVLFLIAFAVRMLNYSSIFVGDKVRFLEFDPFYHMRRAISFAENFPKIWNFDTYIDYPNGAVVGWGPLYDWTIALISNILGLGHPSRHLIETVGAYFPVFIGSLSAIVIYFIAKEIFSDLDTAESKVKDSTKFKKGKKNQTVQEIKKSWKNLKSWQIGLISGLLLAVIPAFVQVSFLGFTDHHVAEVLLSTTAFLFLLKAIKAEDKRNRYIFSVLTIFVLVCAMLTWPGTPIFIGIICVYAIVQCIIEKEYKYLLVIIGTLLVLYTGAYFVSPDTYNRLNGGIGFLLKDRIELQQVQETQPLFFTFTGKFVTEPSWYAFNTSLYIAIIGMILFIMNMIRHNPLKSYTKSNRVRMFFLIWTLIALILNLYQTRFIYLFAVNLVILCAYLITELINSNKMSKEMLGIAFITMILIPSVQMDNMMSENPLMLSSDWFATSEWIKDNTPDPNGNWALPSKEKIPDYGIMSWWDYGNYLLYLSERPVIANNFQLGAEDSAKFFSSENETEANKILTEKRAKYVVVDYRIGLNVLNENGRTYVRGSWISVAFLSGKNMSYYLDRMNMPNDRYLNTTYAKLYLFDGKGMDKYKLVHKSETLYPDIFGKPIEEIKVFEYTG